MPSSSPTAGRSSSRSGPRIAATERSDCGSRSLTRGLASLPRTRAGCFRIQPARHRSRLCAPGYCLGLAISKTLVERMGGEIACRASPARAGRFWFTAPSASRGLLRPARPRLATMCVRWCSPKSPPVLESVVAQLRSLGVQAESVTEVQRLGDSLRQAHERGEPADLVLVDLGRYRRAGRSRPASQCTGTL